MSSSGPLIPTIADWTEHELRRIIRTELQPSSVSSASSIPYLRTTEFAAIAGSTPKDGTEVYLIADGTDLNTAGTTWHMRYNALSPSSSKWEFIGGGPLWQMVSDNVTAVETTASAAYTDLATVGPLVTVPRSGWFEVSFGCTADPNGVAGDIAMMTIQVGGAAAGDANSIQTRSSDLESIARTMMFTANIGDQLVARYRVTAGTGRFRARWISVRPIQLS